MKPYDIVKNILLKSKILSTEIINEFYNPFYVNIALSLYYENVILVQEMNKNPFIPKIGQYLYYYYGCNKVQNLIWHNKTTFKYIQESSIDIAKMKYPHLSERKILESLKFMNLELNYIDRTEKI